MKLYRAAEMRAADQAAAEGGVAFILLMENAARAVAEAALRHFPGVQRVLVLAGKGNNGGDAYGAARHLLLAGREVTVLELAPSPGSDEAGAMRAALLAHGLKPTGLEAGSLARQLQDAELVVDGLFGSGLTRALEGELAECTKRINAATAPVLSIDVPSGLGSDSGAVIGPHIRAAHTVQLAGPKVASAFYPAASAFGVWEVADIGIPAGLLGREAQTLLLDHETVRAWLPTREPDTHKYGVGTVLVVAGSKRYGGAAKLTAHAALRGGAGLVTLVSTAPAEGAWPELIVEGLEDWNDEALKTILALSENRRQTLVLGPGLADAAKPFAVALLQGADVPTVLDAGALLNEEGWWQAVRAHGRCVLTPHSGEAAPLLGRSAKEIAAAPLEAAAELAAKANAVVVLKGRSTVVAAPDGRLAVSTSGHPGMATGGSGDVLAGLLGAFVEEGAVFERACAAVFVHGLAGEEAAERFGDGLVASDLIHAFAGAWLALSRG